MFAESHNPPHFHAEYSEYRGTFSIETGQIMQGDFPPNKSTLVTAWAIIHKNELLENWNTLAEGLRASKIDPLK